MSNEYGKLVVLSPPPRLLSNTPPKAATSLSSLNHEPTHPGAKAWEREIEKKIIIIIETHEPINVHYTEW